mmetsp:Transcript_21008/g.42853  ORF Transcript_21008/g.42853 Transcript_21008/m.42853 type:complete len:92 (+) Transcript_21008:555-830(+)
MPFEIFGNGESGGPEAASDAGVPVLGENDGNFVDEEEGRYGWSWGGAQMRGAVVPNGCHCVVARLKKKQRTLRDMVVIYKKFRIMCVNRGQ